MVSDFPAVVDAWVFVHASVRPLRSKASLVRSCGALAHAPVVLAMPAYHYCSLAKADCYQDLTAFDGLILSYCGALFVRQSSNAVGAYEAKTRLSELLEKVGAREEIVITRHGHPPPADPTRFSKISTIHRRAALEAVPHLQC